MTNGSDTLRRLERLNGSMARALERAAHDFLSAASAVGTILDTLRCAESGETAKGLAEKMAPGFDRLQRMITSAAKRLESVDDSRGDPLLLG